MAEVPNEGLNQILTGIKQPDLSSMQPTQIPDPIPVQQMKFFAPNMNEMNYQNKDDGLKEQEEEIMEGKEPNQLNFDPNLIQNLDKDYISNGLNE